LPLRISAPLLVAIALSGVGIGGMDPAEGQPIRGGVGCPDSGAGVLPGAGSSLPVNPLGQLRQTQHLHPIGQRATAVPRDHHKGLLRLKIGPGLMAASAQPWTEAAFHLDHPQDQLTRARVIGARAGSNDFTPAAARPPHRRRGM